MRLPEIEWKPVSRPVVIAWMSFYALLLLYLAARHPDREHRPPAGVVRAAGDHGMVLVAFSKLATCPGACGGRAAVTVFFHAVQGISDLSRLPRHAVGLAIDQRQRALAAFSL